MADAVKPLPLADIVERKIAAFALTACDKMAKEAEAYAQANRPWQDNTGMARKLVKGIVLDGSEQSYDVYEVETTKDKKGKSNKKGTAVIKDSEGRIGIALVHRVNYGKYLEEANDGKYAILKPTLEHFKAKFLQTANEYFGGKR
jgi:hypothetical protein